MMRKLDRDVLKGWDVLIVDDDPKSLDVVSRILIHYGAKVHHAQNGVVGLAQAQMIRPRLIISDLSMPDMNGWTMLSRIKGDRDLSDIPVIALTAHAMIGDREKALAAGFSHYMTKPLNPATFVKDLLHLLGKDDAIEESK